jgi:two-component system CheB/CheR fusion protein
MPTVPEINRLVAIGVGASAGGLDALTRLLVNLPKNMTGFVFFIAQHLSPHYKSNLSIILQKSSPFAVIEAEDEMLIFQNRIYVAPRPKQITMECRARQVSGVRSI